MERRRSNPAIPTRPVPRRPNVPGSGTVGGGVTGVPVWTKPVLEFDPGHCVTPRQMKWNPSALIWPVLTPLRVNVNVEGLLPPAKFQSYAYLKLANVPLLLNPVTFRPLLRPVSELLSRVAVVSIKRSPPLPF